MLASFNSRKCYVESVYNQKISSGLKSNCIGKNEKHCIDKS